MNKNIWLLFFALQSFMIFAGGKKGSYVSPHAGKVVSPTQYRKPAPQPLPKSSKPKKQTFTNRI